MLNLDDDEIDLALACARIACDEFDDDSNVVAYFARRVRALIARIEQYQEDRRNGDA